MAFVFPGMTAFHVSTIICVLEVLRGTSGCSPDLESFLRSRLRYKTASPISNPPPHVRMILFFKKITLAALVYAQTPPTPPQPVSPCATTSPPDAHHEPHPFSALIVSVRLIISGHPLAVPTLHAFLLTRTTRRPFCNTSRLCLPETRLRRLRLFRYLFAGVVYQVLPSLNYTIQPQNRQNRYRFRNDLRKLQLS